MGKPERKAAYRRVRVAFSVQLPSVVLLAVGSLLISAGIWVVPGHAASSSLLVVFGAGQVILGAILPRVASFSLGAGGIRAVLVQTERKMLAAGLNQDDRALARMTALMIAYSIPQELGPALATDIAEAAVAAVKDDPQRLEAIDPTVLRGLEGAAVNLYDATEKALRVLEPDTRRARGELDPPAKKPRGELDPGTDEVPDESVDGAEIESGLEGFWEDPEPPAQ